MSQLSHAQFPLRRHPNLLVDHRRSRSAAVAEPRGANGEAVTGSGGRLHFGMVAGIKSERWPTSNRNPRPDCLGIRTITAETTTGSAEALRFDLAYITRMIADIVQNPFVGREIVGRTTLRLMERGFDDAKLGKL